MSNVSATLWVKQYVQNEKKKTTTKQGGRNRLLILSGLETFHQNIMKAIPSHRVFAFPKQQRCESKASLQCSSVSSCHLELSGVTSKFSTTDVPLGRGVFPAPLLTSAGSSRTDGQKGLASCPAFSPVENHVEKGETPHGG